MWYEIARRPTGAAAHVVPLLLGMATYRVRLHDGTNGAGDDIHPYRRVDRTEPFSTISSAFLPGMGLSSGMEMV